MKRGREGDRKLSVTLKEQERKKKTKCDSNQAETKDPNQRLISGVNDGGKLRGGGCMERKG